MDQLNLFGNEDKKKSIGSTIIDYASASSILTKTTGFMEGYDYANDNLNLGLHEFAHAIHLHGLKSSDASLLQFAKMYVKIRDYIEISEVLEKLIASNYFRIYAYTNHFEFIAVVLEHFFETPEQFEIEHPELFKKVRKMINF